MKFLLIFLLSSFFTLHATDPFIFGKPDTSHIEVNNRVLANVNAKAITVVDVMKKMDMTFLKHFPQYTSSPQARIQFYEINWKHVLQELIDKELILADALENKIPLSSGDVRQEMELLFGPNIIANLDKIGLPFDEAFKIVQGDLLLKRTMMIRVNSKAMRSVTPQLIREAYQEYASKNIKKEAWNYQVITIKNPDSVAGAETAHLAYRLLKEDQIPLDELQKNLKSEKDTVSISEPLYQTENEMAEGIKSALKGMQAGSISEPLIQKSRKNKNSTIYRIIVLKEIVPAGAVPYNEIETQLKNELYEKAIGQESDAYIQKLHLHYGISENYISEMVPDDFQPFLLK